MYNTKYCRAGGFDCNCHEITDGSDPWERCKITASHVNFYEVCPVPSKAVPLQTKEPASVAQQAQGGPATWDEPSPNIKPKWFCPICGNTYGGDVEKCPNEGVVQPA